MDTPVIVIFTDFGTADGRAAKLTGTIQRVDASLDVCFCQHHFPRGDIPILSEMLCSFLTYFPADTVCIAIAEREGRQDRPLAARTHDGKIILTPDNGTLTVWQETHGLAEARLLDTGDFPGDRDPYAHAAGLLASGTRAFSALGPALPVAALQRFPRPPSAVEEGLVRCGIGSVIKTFGNVNLAVRIDRFSESGIRIGERPQIRIERDGAPVFDAPVAYERSFGCVAEGAPVLFNGSSGDMGLSLNQRSFAAAYLPELLDGSGENRRYTVIIEKRQEEQL